MIRKILLSLSILISYSTFGQNWCVETDSLFYAQGGDINSVSADFNNDGLIDIVAISGATVIVSLNNGLSFIGPPNSNTVGSGTSDIKYGYINNDNFLDVAVANPGSDNVSVLLNNGSGNFLIPINFALAIGSSPTAIELFDMDGDGDQDMVVGSKDSISLYSNPGNGFFLPPTHIILSGLNCKSIGVGNFNSDTLPDIFASGGQYSTSYLILLNQGNNVFNTQSSGVTQVSNRSQLLFDFDNDNDIDVLLSGSTEVLVNDGIGNFTLDSLIQGQTFYGFNQFIGADFDHDNDLDLAYVVTNLYQNLYVFLNNGIGTYALDSIYSIYSQINFINSSDYNNDGDVDLYVSMGSFGTILRGDGNGHFSFVPNYPINDWARYTHSDDFNNDGFDDIAVLTNHPSSNLNILISNGFGIFNPYSSFSAGSYGGYDFSISSGDIDADGDKDLVCGTNQIYALFNDGTGNFSVSMNYPITNTSASKMADMDNDGDLDVIANINGTLYSMENNGSGFFSYTNFFTPTSGSQFYKHELVDIDKDSLIDIVLYHSYGSGISFIKNNGNWNFTNPNQISSTGHHTILTVSDFNGDNEPDIAAYDISNGLQIFINLGNTSFNLTNSPFSNSHGFLFKSLNHADIDLDGDQDLISLSINYSIVFENDGTGNFNKWKKYPSCQMSSNSCVGDFNNDGKTDWATGQNLDQTVSVYLNCSTIGIEEKYEKDTGPYLAYPNPVEDYLYFRKNENTEFVCKIYNVLGEELFSNDNSTSNGINVSTFAKGIYVYKLFDKKNHRQQGTGKFIKI